jgi:phospholipid/cholesterol/gamma-HCH transport system permease protein
MRSRVFPFALPGLAAWRRWQAMARLLGLTLLALVRPASYDAPTRHAIMQTLGLTLWPVLAGYLLASLLITSVLTRIIGVTADSYGLSHLALEAIVRVHFIELLPLAAAVFVAIRAMPVMLTACVSLGRQGQQPDPRPLLPAIAGNALAVFVLAVFSGMLGLVVAYLVAYGLSPWALPGYSRMLGQVFDPLLGLGLLLKLLLFSLIVGFAPATALCDAARGAAGQADRLSISIMARLLFLLVLVEAAFLATTRF